MFIIPFSSLYKCSHLSFLKWFHIFLHFPELCQFPFYILLRSGCYPLLSGPFGPLFVFCVLLVLWLCPCFLVYWVFFICRFICFVATFLWWILIIYWKVVLPFFILFLMASLCWGGWDDFTVTCVWMRLILVEGIARGFLLLGWGMGLGSFPGLAV